MENVINHLLANNQAVQAIVGNRVFPVFADWSLSVDRTTGKLLPTVVYHRDDTSVELDLLASPMLFVGSMTIDYYAETFLDEYGLGNAIFAALHNQQGTYGNQKVITVKFAGRSSLDDVENEGRFVFHGQQTYRVTIKADFQAAFTWDVGSIEGLAFVGGAAAIS